MTTFTSVILQGG